LRVFTWLLGILQTVAAATKTAQTAEIPETTLNSVRGAICECVCRGSCDGSVCDQDGTVSCIRDAFAGIDGFPPSLEKIINEYRNLM
jgi:hypothetical protein